MATTTITNDATEMAADHRATIEAMHAVFGDDAHELAAKAEHEYRTTLAPWRRCVDRVVGEYLRNGTGKG